MGETDFDKKIIESGYKEYPKTPFDHDGIEKNYQKCVTDKKGKKYFIDIHKWSAMTHPHTGETFPENYEYEVYLYNHERLPIRMLFYAGWELEAVEKHVEKMFQTGEYDYYELYD